MDLLSPLSAVILTYREADANALGRIGEEMRRCIEVIGPKTPMFVLHTCHRVEAYLYGASEEELSSLVERYKRHVESARILRGIEAARHLFRVAAGLESMLLGETDILGQLEEAYDRQVRAGFTRGLLKTVVERAVRVGKKVRTETGISRGPAGLGSLSIIYVSQFVDLKSAKVAVLGAGAVGAGLAKELAERGVAKLYILNRTLEKATEVAKKTGAEARPLTREEVERCLLECDVVFSAVHTLEYVIDMIPPGASVKVVVDLGVPQSVAPGLPIKVVRLSDLAELAQRYSALRKEEAKKAEAIVEEELEMLPKALAKRAVEEAVAEVMARAVEIAEEEGRRAGCEVAQLAAKTTVKRLLLPIVEELKKMAENGRVEHALEVSQIFTRLVGRPVESHKT
ncbi:glutamyl-tRNA reductase [Pyrobaculum sp.]|uniref:glutamyl-tRNA reductase n=1 Tax=Pyrobaculum sp. TaxID=2004705 RepID=UPI0031785476